MDTSFTETLTIVSPDDNLELVRRQITERAAGLQLGLAKVDEEPRGASGVTALNITVVGSPERISDLEEEMASDSWGTPGHDPETAVISSTMQWARVWLRRLRRIRRAEKSGRRLSRLGRQRRTAGGSGSPSPR
jgi:hypothetical protein